MIDVNEEIMELCEKEYLEKTLAVPIGRMKDDVVYMDFTKISGLFIAGATGTGKSVLIDWIIRGLMYKNFPSDVKFCLIDPKKIELNEYNNLDYIINNVSLSNSNEILDSLEYINKVINFRLDELSSNECLSMKDYTKKTKKSWPHIFIVVEEGYDIIDNLKIRNSFEKILIYGKDIGMHLIFSTNAYLDKFVKNRFIDMFKYKATFDLASEEQEKLINLKNSNWLKSPGDALIKGFNSKVYRFQSIDLEDKNDCALLQSNNN